MATRSKTLGILFCLTLALLLAGCEESQPVGPLSPAVLPPQTRLTSMSFVDQDHGWVVGADCPANAATPTAGPCRALIYATSDGGLAWSPEGRVLLGPRKLQFTDANNGWLIGGIGQQCGATACPNVVMQTTDGGRTWNRTLTTSVALVDEVFASPRDGWVLGEDCVNGSDCKAVLVTTASGGETWSNQDLPLTGTDVRLDRLSPAVGWVGGIDQGQAVLLGTRDDGRHWSRIETPCRGTSLAFDFHSASDGWLACTGQPNVGAADSALFRTGDGGQTWQPLSQLPPNLSTRLENGTIVTIAFSSLDDGWIVGGHGDVLATRDGGKTWEQVLSAGGPLAAGLFVDATHGWAFGDQTVWRTIDAGKNWSKQSVR